MESCNIRYYYAKATLDVALLQWLNCILVKEDHHQPLIDPDTKRRAQSRQNTRPEALHLQLKCPIPMTVFKSNRSLMNLWERTKVTCPLRQSFAVMGIERSTRTTLLTLLSVTPEFEGNIFIHHLNFSQPKRRTRNKK